MIVDQKINKGFVGAFLLDGDLEGTKLALTKKPNWFRRVLTNLMLGWKWVGLKELKANKE